MTEQTEQATSASSTLPSKCSQCITQTCRWKSIYYFCCRSRRDLRIFWLSYVLILMLLFIIFMVAFLLPSSVTIRYQAWYNDSCTIDTQTSTPMMECDPSLRLFCSKVTERCSCLQNMIWNGSFCDCSSGMFYTGAYCQERAVFGQQCQVNIDFCMENLVCSSVTNTCDCPSSSYYNQTTCNSKITFNASTPCTLSSQCVTGLVCSSNVCTCPSSQSWNGNGCSKSSTYGEYCASSVTCDSSALLICNGTYSRCTCNVNFYWDGQICRSRLANGTSCNNTQQCYSGLYCLNNYCQCPLINTQYWSSQSLTCALCFGYNLFLSDGICYRIPTPTNTTFGTYAVLSSSYSLPTVQYDTQFNYLFNQYVRVFNWTPIYFATTNPIINYFQWSLDGTVIKPNYFCNDTLPLNATGYVLAFKLETNMPCLRAWPSSTIGQLVQQLNTYDYHS